MRELANDSSHFANASRTSWCIFGIAGIERQAEALEAESAAAGFWDNPQSAQEVMKRLSALRQRSATSRGLETGVGDLLGLVELAADKDDETIATDITRNADALERELKALEFELSFSGPYDDRNAIAQSTPAPAAPNRRTGRRCCCGCTCAGENAQLPGGGDGRDARRRGRIKSATIEVTGAYAYGYLKSERGVHRLVRLSPLRSAHARQTSFAPRRSAARSGRCREVKISPDDIRVDVFARAATAARTAEELDRDPRHAPADEHRRHVPERAFTAPQPRVGDARA